MQMELIMEMLSKLSPERLGQLVAEVQQPQAIMDMSPGKDVGFKGTTMPSMMNQNRGIYSGPVGRK